jgi:hypothetical protein
MSVLDTAPHATQRISAVLQDIEPAQRPAGTHLIARSMIRHRVGLWFLLAASLLLFLCASIQISGTAGASGADMLTVSVAVLVWLAVYVASTTWVFGTPYLLATAYVLPLVLFHFGLIVQEAFGFVVVDEFRTDFGHWITLAGWYTNLALACIGLAFAIASLASRPPPPISRELAVRLAKHNLNKLHNLGVGLFLASLVFFAIGIMQQGNILKYDRYALWFEGDADRRGLGVYNSIAPTAALVLVIAAQTPSQKRWSYLIGVITFVLFLLSGNRSPALFPLLLGAILWVKSGRKIPTLMASGVVVLTLLMIPVLANLRSTHRFDEISVSAIRESASRASVGSALTELGGSVEILATTLRDIPAKEPYRFGATYLMYLRAIVPNPGLHLRSAEDVHARGALEEGMLNVPPHEWAAIKILGVDNALYRGAGVGFSAVAEPYFNFGYFGVVVFFLLMGLVLARMEITHLLLDYRWLLFASIFYWLLLPTVRNELNDFIKPASFVVTSIAIWLLVRRFTPWTSRQ